MRRTVAITIDSCYSCPHHVFDPQEMEYYELWWGKSICIHPKRKKIIELTNINDDISNIPIPDDCPLI